MSLLQVVGKILRPNAATATAAAAADVKAPAAVTADVKAPAAADVKAPAAPSTMRDRVRAALKADASHHYAGVKDGLHTMADLATCVSGDGLRKNWDGTIPAILNKYTASKASSAHWAEQLHHLECVSGFIDKNLIVAGGAVSNMLLGRAPSDIDLFLVGLDQAAAKAKINALADHLAAVCAAKNNKDKLHVYRNERCITFVSARRNFCPIQVILCQYATMSEVLHSFDLGSSAAAYDGATVYFTEVGKFAFEYMLNIVDLTKRRSSYEHRLCKYFGRGFGLVSEALPVGEFKDGPNKMQGLSVWGAVAIALDGSITSYMDAHHMQPTAKKTEWASAYEQSRANYNPRHIRTLDETNLTNIAAFAQKNSADAKSADTKSADTKSADTKSAPADTDNARAFLVAHAEYKKGVDVTTIPLTFVNLPGMLNVFATRNTFSHQKLAKLFGSAVADMIGAAVYAAAAESKEFETAPLSAAIIENITSKNTIPFALATPIRDGELCGLKALANAGAAQDWFKLDK